ncbi:MAG: hypothetical protein AAGE43_19365 [Pseudomonadota bacterium]
MNQLSEGAQMILGAYALSDTHTLAGAEVEEMSAGAIVKEDATDALTELVHAELAQVLPDGSFRLTREGIEITLKLQEALSQRE